MFWADWHGIINTKCVFIILSALVWVGVKLTKDGVGKAVSKAVPVVGGIISGGVTVATFLPMTKKLQKELSKFAAMSPKNLEKANTAADIVLADFEVEQTMFVWKSRDDYERYSDDELQ